MNISKELKAAIMDYLRFRVECFNVGSCRAVSIKRENAIILSMNDITFSETCVYSHGKHIVNINNRYKPLKKINSVKMLKPTLEVIS